MKCPDCDGLMEVIDSRAVGDFVRWRRYRCQHCKRRWTSYEHLAPEKNAEKEKLGSSKAPSEPQPIGQESEGADWIEAAIRAEQQAKTVSQF
jgi:hypothetical protein